MRLFAAFVVACSLFMGCAQVKVEVKPSITVEWPLGTVLVSKNKNPADNTSPGDQNHLAIYVGDGKIIEAQKDPGFVIETPFAAYKARDYIWLPMFPLDSKVGEKAATKAKSLVGTAYKPLLFNCVTVVKESYEYALDRRLALRKPDDILTMTDVFSPKWSGYKPKGPEVPGKPSQPLEPIVVPEKKAV